VSRPLIAFNQEPAAHLFVDYLKTQSIPASVRYAESGNQFIIMLHNESDAEKARSLAEQFVEQPDHPRYQQAAWQTGKHVELDNRERSLDMRTLIVRARRAPFCTSILVICSLVFALSVLGLFSPIAHLLMMQPVPELIQTHQWWRLIGPAFLHFSILHFIFNLLWWAILGSQIERKLGMSMLILVFVVSAVLSNLGQAIVSGPEFGGLSGVVYAMMGFTWWAGWLKPEWGIHLQKAIVGFMLVWLVLGYFDVLWVNMANTAHTVGLLTGCAMAAILSIGSDRSRASSDTGTS